MNLGPGKEIAIKNIIGGNWQNLNMDFDTRLSSNPMQDFLLLLAALWSHRDSTCPEEVHTEVLVVKRHDVCNSLSNTGGCQTIGECG